MVNKSLTLSGGGIEIDLYSWMKNHTLDGAEALEGITGFGLPPQTPRWFEGAGDGAIHRGTRVLPRDIEIPLVVQGADRRILNDMLSKVARVLDPRWSPARLSFGLPEGDSWSLEVVRTEGGDWEREREVTDNETWVVTQISLRAGQPFWVRDRSEHFEVSQDMTGRGLMPKLAELQLSSGGAFGTRTVENIGDADAWPIWTIKGPFSRFKFTGPRGEILEWTGTIAANEGLIVDSKAGTIKDFNGVNRYNGLSSGPRFWSIAPGSSRVTVEASDAGAGSHILCEWKPRRWMVA